MIHVGLTGGIATGKSTVSGILQQAGAHIIDADKIAHAAIAKGEPAWDDIVAHFGPAVLGPNGDINRAALGSIIFNNAAEKEVLNGIVHPRVWREIDRQRVRLEESDPQGIIILDIPLLIETGWHRNMPEVILVYAPEKIQRQRLMAGNRLTRQEAMARIRSQMPIDEKKRYASMIIDNSGDLATTREKTLAVYHYLMSRQKR